MNNSLKNIILVIVSFSVLEESTPLNHLVCENSQTSINCQYGHYVNIVSAKWGRDDNSTCGPSTDCNIMEDKTSTIRFSCHGKQTCDIIQVNEGRFGPVACSVPRYLRIVYNCTDTSTDDCNSKLCKNGTCTKIRPFHCVCYPGYTGTRCENDIDECVSNPCVHGTCNNDINSYHCICNPGYTGINCHTDIDECVSNPCVHGTCINDVNSYHCICNPGYTGINCHTEINECSSSPCINGTCLDRVNGFTCHCSPGFQGILCNQTVHQVYTHLHNDHEPKDKETTAYTIPAAIASCLFILLLLVIGILLFSRKFRRPKVSTEDDMMADIMKQYNEPLSDQANTKFTRVS